MCSIVVCSEMVLTSFANNRFIFNLTSFVTGKVYLLARLCIMKFILVYCHLKRFLHFKLT